jgi:hypothetical protein
MRNQFEAFLVGAQRHGPQGLVERIAQIEIDRVQGQLARLDLGEIQNVVDERQERIR